MQNLWVLAVQSEKGSLVRRLTITERPGYEPDGYGFARRVEDKLFGMALAINKREQERKIMQDPDVKAFPQQLAAACTCKSGFGCIVHGVAPDTLGGCASSNDQRAQKDPWTAKGKVQVSAAFSAPETLTAQLRRLRFEIQTTQTRLAEADKLIEKVLAGL